MHAYPIIDTVTLCGSEVAGALLQSTCLDVHTW
jgi:hypothetical protein